MRTVLLTVLIIADLSAKDRPAKRDTTIYNSRISLQYAEEGAAALVCDGREVPNRIDVLPPYDNFMGSSESGFKLAGISLSYSPGVKANHFDISRTFVLQGDSEEITSKELGASEQHGCDNELYKTGSYFSAGTSPNGNPMLTVHTNLFAASRWCVRGRSICGVETKSQLTVNYEIEKQSEQSCNDQPDRNMFQIKYVNQNFSDAGKENSCGSTLAVLGAVTGGFSGAIIGASISVAAENMLKPAGVAPTTSNSYDIPRAGKVSLTFCPTNVSILIASPTRAQIKFTDTVRELPEPVACYLYRTYTRSMMVTAETLKPTHEIPIAAKDSWWDLAVRVWGDGRTFPLLMGANPSVRRLEPGKRVSVPPPSVFSDPLMIFESDTLWALAKRMNQRPTSLDSLHRQIRPRTPSVNLVYPFGRVTAVKH